MKSYNIKLPGIFILLLLTPSPYLLKDPQAIKNIYCNKRIIQDNRETFFQLII